MRKKIGYSLFLMIFMAFVFVLASCTKTSNTDSQTSTSSTSVSTTTQTPENEKGVYTVTFDSNGGSQVASQTIKEGNKVTEPDTPTKIGYLFSGWYYKDAKWDFANNTVTDNMILKAKWDILKYTLTLTNNQTEAGTISEGGSYEYNETVTIKATSVIPYKFVGWYDGIRKVSGNAEYTFKMPAKDITYEAKFEENADTPYIVEHYKQNLADDDDYTLAETENLKGVATKQTAAVAKEYEGFSAPSTIEQVTIDVSGVTVVKIYYTRNTYTLTLTKSVEAGGTISGANTYKYEEEVTLEVTLNAGYTFNGWYNGEELVSTDNPYTFNMPASNLTYEAKITANTDTQYKVNHFKQNIDDDEYVLFELEELTGTTNTLTNASVKTYEGFTSPEITQVNINGDGSTVINLYYDRNEYTAYLSSSISNVGSISGATTYKYGAEVTISIDFGEGYTFNGWYDGTTQVSDENPYTFAMPAADVKLVASLSINEYLVTFNNLSGLTVTGVDSGEYYNYGTEITLTAADVPTGAKLKWYISDDNYSNENPFKFTVPAADITVSLTKLYERVDDKIYFGTYPQTQITDSDLIAGLNIFAGELPTATDLGAWDEYNYYIQGVVTSYTYYQDIDFDNDGTYDYRGVYFTSYRPNSSVNIVSGAAQSSQDDNGYEINTTYWLKYDSIEWNILSESNGKAIIIANLILDSQEFYSSDSKNSFEHNGGTGYSDNYALSNIRKWLNDDFYKTAFKDYEKAIINLTEVDNSSTTLQADSATYACDNTNDYIYLLSYQDVITYYTTDESRLAKGSDYAKCMGLYVSSEYSMWWTRSPFYYNANTANGISAAGELKNYGVAYTNRGVRPVLSITL